MTNFGQKGSLFTEKTCDKPPALTSASPKWSKLPTLHISGNDLTTFAFPSKHHPSPCYHLSMSDLVQHSLAQHGNATLHACANAPASNARVFLTNESAIDFWRRRKLRPQLPTTSLGEGSSTVSTLAAFMPKHFGVGKFPVHVAVPPSTRRHNNSHIQFHNQKFDSDSFLRINEMVRVLSPEQIFLQAAQTMSLPKLTLLGLEFCGKYRLAPHEEAGFIDAKSITSREALAKVANQANGPGAHAAKAAASFVLNNSASPMESIVYLLLCLPTKYGGYGICAPVLNAPIDVSKSATIDNSVCKFCDLLWPQAKFALEYDSTQFHEKLGRQAADSVRRAQLALEGVKVLTVHGAQVYNVDAMDDIAHGVARELGLRLRIRRADFTERRADLRSQLLDL